MRNRKGSDVSSRQVSGPGRSFAGVLAVLAPIVFFVAALALVLAAPGCELTGTLEEEVQKDLKYEPANLTASALEERVKEIDAQYAEPRTPTKVKLSYETALVSISHVNSYAALWRGTRACAWLALKAPDRKTREEYAKKGIEMGREAIKPTTTSTRVESWYYLSLCLAGLADAQGTASRDGVRKMHQRMEMARSIDAGYDHCGPDRFIGQLMVETADRPTWAVGTLDKGLEHLKRAAETCPDFGENHLAYAKALINVDEPAPARRELEKVLACPKPADYTAEHEEWLQEATQLLTDLTPSS